MHEEVLIGVAGIIVLGIAAQWFAWRLRMPSILFLLLAGFLAGPVTGLIHPDDLFGELLSPIVSIAVALILFEGGLSLKVSELRRIGRVVRNLITVGAFLTWVLGAIGAYVILGLDPALSALLGAILVVTGPTVITPLLRDVRPAGQIGSILRWEGILIDPVGVTLALLVFEAIFIGDFQQATAMAVFGFVETLIIGVVIGIVAAMVLTVFLRRYWIPDFLQNAVTVMMVVGAFAFSDIFQPESGLLTVTIMGVILANQRATPVKHIIEFKENLGVMLLSNLFVVLAARLEMSDLSLLGVESLLFIAFLMLIVRPFAVYISTLGSQLNWRERVFAAALAPRGIVAAATASIFALELMEVGHPQAERLAPLTLSVIVVTVAVYGLSAKPLARLLGVAQPRPQGLVIVGAHAWSRAIAKEVQDKGFRVLMVDSNWDHIHAARMEGLSAFYGNVLAEEVQEELDLSGTGRLLALTPNDEVNSLAALHFIEVFGRAEVYQLPCNQESLTDSVPQHLRGRLLFGDEACYDCLNDFFEKGAVVKTTPLTEAFPYASYRAQYAKRALPLFLIDESEGLLIFAMDQPPQPRIGQSIVSVVLPEAEALPLTEPSLTA